MSYSKIEAGSPDTWGQKSFLGLRGKYMVGKDLGLSSCEMSLNLLQPGQASPFAHSHKENEEVYLVVSGSGFFYVDGEEMEIQAGTLVRCDPPAVRAWKAGPSGLAMVVIQAQKGSLRQSTLEDGVREPQAAPSWVR